MDRYGQQPEYSLIIYPDDENGHGADMGKQSANTNHDDLIRAMEGYGEKAWFFLQKGQPDKALDEYERAVEIAATIDEPKHEAVFLSFMAVALRDTGDTARAHDCLSRSIEIANSLGLFAVEIHARLVLAEIYRDEGRPREAIELFLDGLDMAAAGDDPVSIELALSNLGRLYLERGWAEQAAACFLQALEIREDSLDRAAILGSLGLAMAELGMLQEAISHYRTAYLEAEFLEDGQSMAICRGSEGNALHALGRYENALDCYHQALKLSRGKKDARREGAWLGNIGTTWLKLGDIDKAIEFCTRAETIARKVGDVQSQAAHLDSLGDCLYEKGDLEQAKARYEEALSLSETIEDRLGKRIYLTDLGKLHQELGQLQPAFEYFGQAVNLFDEQRATIHADDLKTSFSNRGENLYKDVVKVCMSMGKRVEALEYVGRAKSRALLDLLSNSPIDISLLADGGDQSLKKLIDKEKELRERIDHFERVIWQGPSSGEPSVSRGAIFSGIDAKVIYAEWRDTVNQLKRLHPNYGTLVSASTLDYAEIIALWKGKESLLASGTAICEFFYTDDYIMAATVWSGAKEPACHFVADRARRDELMEDIGTLLEMSSTEGWEVPTSLCRRIYDCLVRPALQDLPERIDRLIIIPHGSLFHLPFAALHDGDNYLCQKFALSYLPSLTLVPVLAQSRREFKKDENVNYLVSAISDYSATRKDGLVFSSTLRSSAGLDDLSYTMEEGRSVLEVGERSAINSRLVTNEEVKQVFPEIFGDFSVVHFAGHAIFNQDEPMASGLVLADGTVLTAASILERRALHTQRGLLLVLSACQTGVSAVTPGGEILGLARALMYAGMPNLVLTLWEVADRSTSNIMQDFHTTWQAGKISIAAALRQAQTRAIETGQPVHAWAPFIHFGID
ncbi:MAG: CHAT domain-containing protein [Candidatus Obscuribacterales bacterium]|nr:CHAT domain-containing protein [Candidatus Obscuribacterales bacterium]